MNILEKPILAILSAGMGNRYGGLKQIDPVGTNGELIIDYSIYDAIKAGFEKVIFIIKHEIENDFNDVIGGRIAKYVDTASAYQELDQLPPGYALPDGRTKPWGTTHALLAAKDLIKGPFAVINADDYYGPSAFKTIYDWLSAPNPDKSMLHYAMVGYRIENTVTESGSVARGVCEADDRGFLTSIVERTTVEKTRDGARFSEDCGKTWYSLHPHTLVSMNFWGLNEGFFEDAERNFPDFLDKNLPDNPLKCEYLLPFEINRQIQRGRADVKVLESVDTWHGVTYREDRETVVKAMSEKHARDEYPTPLWQ
jgi:NDP-sugar pyrophosphorylase family protein